MARTISPGHRRSDKNSFARGSFGRGRTTVRQTDTERLEKGKVIVSKRPIDRLACREPKGAILMTPVRPVRPRLKFILVV